MTGLKIRAEYYLACWLMELSYGLTATFRQARYRSMMDTHRLKLKLTGLLSPKKIA